MTDVHFSKKCPRLCVPLCELHLQLRLFDQDTAAGSAAVEEPLPLEYVLEHVPSGTCVHFLIGGVTVKETERLHRLCLHLLYVRDTLLGGLMTFITPEA
jgi:hypothetical protein